MNRGVKVVVKVWLGSFINNEMGWGFSFWLNIDRFWAFYRSGNEFQWQSIFFFLKKKALDPSGLGMTHILNFKLTYL